MRSLLLLLARPAQKPIFGRHMEGWTREREGGGGEK